MTENTHKSGILSTLDIESEENIFWIDYVLTNAIFWIYNTRSHKYICFSQKLYEIGEVEILR